MPLFDESSPNSIAEVRENPSDRNPRAAERSKRSQQRCRKLCNRLWLMQEGFAHPMSQSRGDSCGLGSCHLHLYYHCTFQRGKQNRSSELYQVEIQQGTSNARPGARREALKYACCYYQVSKKVIMVCSRSHTVRGTSPMLNTRVVCVPTSLGSLTMA